MIFQKKYSIITIIIADVNNLSLVACIFYTPLFFTINIAKLQEGTKDELTLVYVQGKGLVAGWGVKNGNPNYDENYQVTQIRKCAKKK